ncbi:MAG: hypothetical protein ABMA13_23170 [Chthoniobacteraceae bacterium]
MKATSQQMAKALTGILLAVSEAIRSLGEVPSGHLYARVMKYLPLEAYEAVIGILVGSGVVEKRGDLLVWKGASCKACGAGPCNDASGHACERGGLAQ